MNFEFSGILLRSNQRSFGRAVERQLLYMVGITLSSGVISYIILSIASSAYVAKGPMSLFVMALTGLIFLLSCIIKEMVQKSARLAKQRLGELEYHHDYKIAKHAPFQQNLMTVLSTYAKRTPISERCTSHVQLDDENTLRIIEKLEEYKPQNKTFTLMVSGENLQTSASQEALAVARGYAKKGLKTLLVDTYSASGNLNSVVALQSQYGFYDLARRPNLIGEIIQCDPESALQIVVSGGDTHESFDWRQKKTLNHVFTAWRAVYDVVIFNARSDIATEFYECLDGGISTGLFVQLGYRPASNSIVTTFSDIAHQFQVIMHQKTSNFDFSLETVSPTPSVVYH
ncbi:MAG: hypothetical protein AAF228_03800 [Pseudomonadota bacterium]